MSNDLKTSYPVLRRYFSQPIVCSFGKFPTWGPENVF